MKKGFFAICLLLTTSIAFSQTEKGDYLVGGNFGFRTNSNNSSFTLTPNVGYFVINHLALGANLTMNFEKEGDARTTELGFGPFARYYFGRSNFRPFLLAGAGYLHNRYKVNNFINTNNGFYSTLGLGGAAFISPSVAFEGIAAYNYSDFKNVGTSNGFSLNFGFQVFINHGKMNNLRHGRLNEQQP